MNTEVQPIYYMRDNHTFRRLSSDSVQAAMAEIEGEFNAGYTHGTLCSKRPGFVDVHATGSKNRLQFFAECQASLQAEYDRTAAQVTPSEAVYAFAAWLTVRPDTLQVGSGRDAAPVAELVHRWVTAQGLPPPRDNYTDYLRITDALKE